MTHNAADLHTRKQVEKPEDFALADGLRLPILCLVPWLATWLPGALKQGPPHPAGAGNAAGKPAHKHSP